MAYRAIGHTSSVDETLFGGKDSSALSKSGRRVITGPLAPSAVVISAQELERIRNGSMIKTEAEIAADKERSQQMKDEKEKLSKDRKDRMRELEKRSVMLAKKTDLEVAEIAKKQAVRNMAEKKLDLNSDVVKLLNSMAKRASAFTIRDQQLEEKARIADIEKEYDDRINMLIEIDRLKDIQRREEEENAKRLKRVEDRKVINEQIDDRQRSRMLALEAREQENQAMRGLMKKYADEDANLTAQKLAERENSRKAVLRANADAIERKKQAKEAEKKELEDIIIYQTLKDHELLRREEEEQAIERTRKERQAKLLAQQEKAQNNAGKVDELRARRAAEEKERNERKREKAEAIKRKTEMTALLESRAQQAADKAAREAAAKRSAEDAILAEMQYTRQRDSLEAEERRIKAERSVAHRIHLQTQIENRAREKSRNGGSDADNDNNIRQDLVREEAKLTAIRDRMVADLVAEGVNPKYLSEMRNVDIGKILKR